MMYIGKVSSIDVKKSSKGEQVMSVVVKAACPSEWGEVRAAHHVGRILQVLTEGVESTTVTRDLKSL